MNNTNIRKLVGTTIVFTDGRKGIICGGSLAYGWARSRDGSIAHEYSWETLARKITINSPFAIN